MVSLPKPIHICIVTSAHAVDDVRVSHKMAYSFHSAGFEVTWVGPDNHGFDKNNYNRYGINYRLFTPQKGKIGRLLNLIKLKEISEQILNVNIFYAPDPDSGLLASFLAKRIGARAVFDIHEVFHEYMLSNWVKGWGVNLLKPLVRNAIKWVCNRSDLVIGVCDSVLEPYRSSRTEKMVVRSCTPDWFAHGLPADVCGESRTQFTLMQGKSTLGRGTDNVLEALAIAKKETPGLRAVMFDVFNEIGEDFGRKQFLKRTHDLDITDIIDFRKPVPMQEMPEILRTCDVGLVSYNKNLGISLPNKVFEYMAIGLPVLAPIYSFEVAKIIESESCGILVDFENPQAIAAAITYLHQNPRECREMGRRGREAFEKRHNWQTEVQPLFARIYSWFPKR